MSDFGSQFNYKQLLENHDLNRVPMIQRDYAQGREPVQSEATEASDSLDHLKAVLMYCLFS